MNSKQVRRVSPKKMRMAVLSAMASVLLLVGMTVPAIASTLQTGSKTCAAGNPFSWITGKTKGTDRFLKAPGAVGQWTYNMNPAVWSSTTKQGAKGGGSWEVFSTNLVNTSATATWCTNYT